MDTEQFISEILCRPAIWMSKHPHHKYRHVIKKLWDEIKQQFPGSTDESLKKKWKNLKDGYRKELKKVPTFRSGDEGLDYQSQWKYFEQLSFLKDEYMPTEGESNLIAEEEELSPSLLQPPPSVSPLPSTSTPSPQQPPTPTPPPQQPPTPHSSGQQIPSQATTSRGNESQNTSRKRLKITEIHSARISVIFNRLEIERKKLKLLEADLAGGKEKDIPRSDDYHFLMSLLPEMEKLNVLQKMRLRNKFTQALMEEISLNQYSAYFTQPPPTEYGINNINNL